MNVTGPYLELVLEAAAAALFVGMLALLELGRRVGNRRLAADPEGARSGLGTVEGAVFGLLGLLVAFAFSGAVSRFDHRRSLIVDESNCVGTAWARVDLLPAEHQPAVRDLFRSYVDARIDIAAKLPDIGAAKAALDNSNRLQSKIWAQAVAACKAEPRDAPTLLLLPALNEMFDVTTVRTAAALRQPPALAFALLFGLALGSAVLAGYDMAGAKKRSWPHMIAFALGITVTIFVILDFEYPRFGLIRLDAADVFLKQARAGMN